MKKHIPVLLKEVIKYLNPQPGENFVDATIGGAGHARAILEKNKPKGKVIGIDRDLQAIKGIKPHPRLILIHGNFKDLKKLVKCPVHPPKFCKAKLWRVNGILFDLGWQINRGLSFQKDEPLSAELKTIINQRPEQELFRIFKEYGEEKYSRRIAKRIRREGPINTTFELRKAIEKAIPRSRTRRGQAQRVLARIFQALRIVVNDELENLKKGLEQAVGILEPGGRLVVISFHSLEDRIVKNFFRDNNNLKILTKKPITPSDIEIKNNPRSRSAKLRAAIKR